MSLRSGALPKPKDPLDRRVPANPKYAGVTATINSGQTIDKFYAKHSQESTNARFKRNTSKQYKRIRLATLQKWIETAMIVLAQPDYLESGESIYSLDDGAGPLERPGSVHSSTVTVSMADTEASVCGDEIGVPPMFMGGPDVQAVLQRTDPSSQDGGVTDARGVTYPSLSGRGQMNENLIQNAMLARETRDASETRETVRSKNTTSSVAIGDESRTGLPPAPPSGLLDAQNLTTRRRHNKILERIHLIPGLRLELGAPMGTGQDKKRVTYLSVPTHTKQFCVVDMRPDEAEFKKSHVWGAVWLPVARLHRAANKMPPDLHHFVKFEESIVVLTGLQGNDAEEAANLLCEYGILQRNVVLLIQTIAEVEQNARSIVAYEY